MRYLMLIAMLAVTGAMPIRAADEGDGSNWGTIEQLYVDAAGTVLRIDFSRDVVNPSGCQGGDFYVRELDGSPASDRFVKTVVAAQLADRKVKFWVEGCSKAQWWGKTRPQIIDIYIGS